MSDQTYKKPDWSTWGHMPTAELWEAIAISCDIEPDSLATAKDFSNEKIFIQFGDVLDHVPPRPEEFNRRIKIALASTHDMGTLKTDGTKGHTDQRVKLSDFARWADERGFSLPPEFPREDKSLAINGQWPWGNHETELLKHLAAAANKFWKLYDPADKTTAPTNKQVSSWLQTEKNVSGRTAEAMASILRPDGLPTGPRK